MGGRPPLGGYLEGHSTLQRLSQQAGIVQTRRIYDLCLLATTTRPFEGGPETHSCPYCPPPPPLGWGPSPRAWSHTQGVGVTSSCIAPQLFCHRPPLTLRSSVACLPKYLPACGSLTWYRPPFCPPLLRWAVVSVAPLPLLPAPPPLAPITFLPPARHTVGGRFVCLPQEISTHGGAAAGAGMYQALSWHSA